MQSKKHSIVESLTNTFLGLLLSFIISQLFYVYEAQVQQYIWAGFEWRISTVSNIIVTVVLTVVSVIRSYMLRRAFNKKTIRSK